MDREFVEKVTKLVIEALEDNGTIKSVPNTKSVKIWSHKSPLPKPIELTTIKRVQSDQTNEIINITPYVK